MHFGTFASAALLTCPLLFLPADDIVGDFEAYNFGTQPDYHFLGMDHPEDKKSKEKKAASAWSNSGAIVIKN